MPAISLVVCLYKERDLLKRLLEHSQGCYDDLVVVHDGSDAEAPGEELLKPLAIDFSQLACGNSLPKGYREPSSPAKPESVHELVLQHGGRYFEGPRARQQEPHWPFGWKMAKHDWILRLDADEFPSEELRNWLIAFRAGTEPEFSGYTCLWPLWNGQKATTKNWPGGRNFLFHRDRVRYFGMAESVPFPDGKYEPINLVLHHQPRRKSNGIRNILFRKQAYCWRAVIAQSLCGTPMKLSRWRWESDQWPLQWKLVYQNPLKHAFIKLVRLPLRQLLDMRKAGEKFDLSVCLNPGLHHWMLGLRVFLEKYYNNCRHS